MTEGQKRGNGEGEKKTMGHRSTRMNADKRKEIEKLNAAVDAFASAMKARLLEKVEAGYTGWDGGEPLSHIANNMAYDAGNIEEVLFGGPGTAYLVEGIIEPLTVDVANRAMFLWHRRDER